MKLIKQIYFELNCWYLGKLTEKLMRFFTEYYLSVTVSVLLLAFINRAIIATNQATIFTFDSWAFFITILIVVPIIVTTIIYFSFWYSKVRPVYNEVKIELEKEERWATLLDQFNKTS